MMEKIKWYKEVLELEPNSKVFFPLARLLVEDGHDTEAVAVLENGLQRHSEYLEARLFLIEILYKNRQKDLCSAQVKKLSDIFASYAGFWQAWAACLADEGDDADTASILRFIAARFITGPLQLHDVLNRGLASLIRDHQKEEAPRSVQPAPDVATETVSQPSGQTDMPEKENMEADLSAEEEVPVTSDQDVALPGEDDIPASATAQASVDTELPAPETAIGETIRPLAPQAVSGSEELEATGQEIEGEPVPPEDTSLLAKAESETHTEETAAVSSENGEQPGMAIIVGETAEAEASMTQPTNDAASMAVEHIEADPSDVQTEESTSGERSQSAHLEATAEQDAPIASEPLIGETAHEEVPDTGADEACQPSDDAASETEIAENIQTTDSEVPMPEETAALQENTTPTEKVVETAGNDAGEHSEYSPEAQPASGYATPDYPLAAACQEDQPGALVEETLSKEIVTDAAGKVETTEQTWTGGTSGEEIQLKAEVSEGEAIHGGMENLQLPHQEELEVKKAEILDPALALLVQDNDSDESEKIATGENVPAANKESAAALISKNAVTEEPFSLRTRSMAEVLAEQGDTQGALDIYQELSASASEPGEAEDIRRRMATLRARLGETDEPLPPRPDNDSGKERLIGMLETLARRVEARVNG